VSLQGWVISKCFVACFMNKRGVCFFLLFLAGLLASAGIALPFYFLVPGAFQIYFPMRHAQGGSIYVCYDCTQPSRPRSAYFYRETPPNTRHKDSAIIGMINCNWRRVFKIRPR